MREIGSDFWLNVNKQIPEKEIDLSFLSLKYRDSIFLSSGRSAISFVLDNIKEKKTNKKALLPAYTCSTVIEPFLMRGYEPFFFNVSKNLFCKKEEILQKIDEIRPDVFLFHDYFGFNTMANLNNDIDGIMDNGIVVINDLTHSVYSEFDHLQADFYVGSFRKWGPVPDGGFALNVIEKYINKPVTADCELAKAKLDAFQEKYMYMEENADNKPLFLDLYKKAESLFEYQEQHYLMSRISRDLQANIDLMSIRKKRRDNFKFLLELFPVSKDIYPVFEVLEDKVTPLYFPIYVRDRLQLQKFLINNDIYCPIIWPKPQVCVGNTNESVGYIYNNLLSIPCDQRYDDEDMDRIIKNIMDF